MVDCVCIAFNTFYKFCSYCIMSNFIKLEFETLDINGKNYLS